METVLWIKDNKDLETVVTHQLLSTTEDTRNWTDCLMEQMGRTGHQAGSLKKTLKLFIMNLVPDTDLIKYHSQHFQENLRWNRNLNTVMALKIVRNITSYGRNT